MSASSHARLAEFAADKNRIRQVERTVHEERAECARELQAATEALQAYYATVAASDGKTDAVKLKKLQGAIRDAQERLEGGEWEDRLKGAEIAHRQLRLRVDQFVMENTEALATEAAEVATERHAEVAAAIEALTAAYHAYAQAQAMWNPLLAHMPKQRFPAHDDLQQLVARFGGVRVPVLIPPLALPVVEDVAA